MVCDRIGIVQPGLLIDLPNVVVDYDNHDDGASGIRICASSKWANLKEDLASLFVGIVSHETLHLALFEFGGESVAESLDNVASLSVATSRVGDIGLVTRYPDGMIGLDSMFTKKGRKERPADR